jgi:hypothetical protein
LPGAVVEVVEAEVRVRVNMVAVAEVEQVLTSALEELEEEQHYPDHSDPAVP